MKNADRYLLAA